MQKKDSRLKDNEHLIFVKGTGYLLKVGYKYTSENEIVAIFQWTDLTKMLHIASVYHGGGKSLAMITTTNNRLHEVPFEVIEQAARMAYDYLDKTKKTEKQNDNA